MFTTTPNTYHSEQHIDGHCQRCNGMLYSMRMGMSKVDSDMGFPIRVRHIPHTRHGAEDDV